MFSPLDKQQEHILLPVECQQDGSLEDVARLRRSPSRSILATLRAKETVTSEDRLTAERNAA
ncbi:MAG: hypothetical protein AUH11_11885 [Acidobacteria bacterium 13_2_20CM_57_17]|nr:MAG: hypothetical protein AUH11_11885 [Acidobacteria bacterium 13_2_20CM_57_17]OLB92429.1 MAG: hypothetical protein AUI02_08205 [Acidobacteria bacterium 13_2_20CM_2_57_12]